jgi:ATP-dependent protease ClpP protease subunit
MTIIRRCRAAISAIAGLLTLLPFAALCDVRLEPGNGKVADLTWVTGTIRPDDYPALLQIAKTIPVGDTWHVDLNSEGGDISTALRMGRLLRERSASANVGKSAVCLSACVFLLAGATQRAVQTHLGARVGVHRPYNPMDQADTIQAQRNQQQVWAKSIQSYLTEMNVSADLYDRMMRVAPHEIRILTRSELEVLGLSKDDPHWEDAQATREAKQLGLAKSEYLARKAQASAVCKQYARPDRLFDDLICEGKILRGLPPSQGIK